MAMWFFHWDTNRFLKKVIVRQISDADYYSANYITYSSSIVFSAWSVIQFNQGRHKNRTDVIFVSAYL